MKFTQFINLKNFRGELDDTTYSYIDQEAEDCGEEDCMDYETQNVSRTDFEKGLEEDDNSGISKLKLLFILIGVGAAILIIILIYIFICCCKKWKTDFQGPIFIPISEFFFEK